ncbi:MAG: hypothetical protein ABIC91_05200 [Nanoarchaeota archaeon]|nr:hypothetical protein [Nanoarchaeota archaeon]MBU1030779.1 hypothetical protein [Nanoarchaeota archaeon]MBU1850511.1 hypothetical protein [Nanoarchaeota archaeon]
MKRTIAVTDNIENINNIWELFVSEEKKFSNNRASYKVTKNNDKLIFEIEAKDVIALKAVTASIQKNLAIYNKIKSLKNEQRKTTKH